MSLPYLLRPIGYMAHAPFAVRALEFAHTGVTGPARIEIYRTLKAVEGGEEISSAVRALSEQPQVETTVIDSPKEVKRLTRLIAGLVARDEDRRIHGAGKEIVHFAGEDRPFARSIYPEEASWWQKSQYLEEFRRLRSDLRERIVETWQHYHRELSHSPKMPIYSTWLEDFMSRSPLERHTVNQVRHYSRKYFLIHKHLIFSADRTASPMLLIEKIERLREYYGLSIPPDLASRLAESEENLKLSRAGSTQEAGEALEVLIPEASETERALALHLFVHRNDPPDHLGLLLGAASLIGLKTGTVPSAFEELAAGMEVSRDILRGASLHFGIPYHSLVDAYKRIVYPDHDFSGLPFYRGPFYFESEEIPQLESYRKEPSRGQWIALARMTQDLSIEEMVEAIRAEFEVLEMNPTLYREMEGDARPIPPNYLNAFMTLLSLDTPPPAIR